MNRLVFFLVSCFFLGESKLVIACGKLSPAFPIVSQAEVSHLEQVVHSVSEELARGKDPRSILVVLDVDGTLLIAQFAHGRRTHVPTSGALKAIQELRGMGVHVVVSSAWNLFSETLVKLRQAGLSDVLDLVGQYEVRRKEVAVRDKSSEKRVKLQVRSAGRVASVQDSKVDPIFYRQKALAPRILLSKREILRIRTVFVVDDTKEDLQVFSQDLDRFESLPNAETVSLLHLAIQEAQ